MKKKMMALMLAGIMVVSGVTGCGKDKKENTDKDEIKWADLTAEELQDIALEGVDGVVKLTGDYSKLSITVPPVAEVTEGAVEAELQSWLDYYPLSFDGECVSGDSVNIDYVGTMDGKEFSGGSAENYDLTLGSGLMIPGFEEQVLGMKVGEEKDFNVTFPAEYSNEEYAGKDATFHTTLNYVKKSEGTGVLDEKWVAAVVEKEGISDKVTDLTADGFKAFVKTTLEDEAKSTYDSNVAQALLQSIMDLCDFSKVPEDIKKQYVEDEKEYQENYISSQYGMKLDEYLEAMEIDEDTFNADIEKSANEYMQNVLGLKTVAIKEKIKVTQEEYEEYIQKYADYYGSASLSEFVKQYAPEYKEDLLESLMLEKVLQKLKADATITESADAAANTTETTEN